MPRIYDAANTDKKAGGEDGFQGSYLERTGHNVHPVHAHCVSLYQAVQIFRGWQVAEGFDFYMCYVVSLHIKSCELCLQISLLELEAFGGFAIVNTAMIDRSRSGLKYILRFII